MKKNVISRQGTVSKPSGPTHSNSYAMKGVTVRYKTPIYVPDLLQLPVTWTKPTLPSSQAFFYDYSVEHKVAEQAKQRAMSIAAEASLQRRHVLAFQQERKQQQAQTSASNNSSSTNTVDALPQPGAPCLPVLSGTDILTPTPVAPTCSTTATAGRVSNTGSGNSSVSPAESGNLLSDGDVKNSPPATNRGATAANDKMDPTTFKSLGNWSIKEFEGDTMDPFEIASLQAINDMEELQSVLQPTTVAPGTSSILAGSSSAASTLVQAGVVSTPQLTSLCPPISSPSPSFNAAAALSVLPLPVAVVSPVTSHSVVPAFTSTITTGTNSTGVCSDGGSTVGASMLGSKSFPLLTDAAKQPLLTSGGSASPDTNTIIRQNDNPSSTSSSHQFQQQQQQLHQQQVPYTVVSGNSFVGHGNAAVPNQVTSIDPFCKTALFRTNPFRTSIEIELAQSGSYPIIPVSSSSQQQQWHSDLDVATLVDLGGTGTDNDSQPIPAPRGSPKKKGTLPSLIESTAAAETSRLIPVPRPRRKSSPSVGMPTSTSDVLPPPPIPQPSPAAVHARATSSASVPFTPPSHSRFGEIGIAVLPPIPPKPHSSSPSTSQPPPEHPPPVYKKHASPLSSRKVSPPPPYSSPSTNQRQHPQATSSPVPQRPPPRVSQKPYFLPDPAASLTMEQKKQVKTIADMGFPLQRVGRAMLKFEDDQTKVLDFLFMVGELEEAQFNGESAETALTVCKDDLEKAKEYLQKLEAYKEFGFHEKAIHEAYTKAKADWNEALDILTRDR